MDWLPAVSFVVGLALGSLTTIAAFGGKVAVIRNDLTHVQDAIDSVKQDVMSIRNTLAR